MSRFRPLSLAVVAALVAACAELKTASPDESGETAATDPSAPGAGSGGGPDGGAAPRQDLPEGTGPGAHGALPSGYCCSDDTECRGRRCAETTPGNRMCLDECRAQETCERYAVTFTCDAPARGEEGYCQPPTGFACIPAAQFGRGTRETGGCCTPTFDGRAGEECEGNLCIALGDGPFVCTHRCDTTKDCPGGYICGPFGTCMPANTGYTCD